LSWPREAVRVEEEKRKLKARIIASTRHNRFGGAFVLKNLQVLLYTSSTITFAILSFKF
jgi:hypothetical protein